jgi:ADP-ribosylglycohydrolase
MEKNNYLKKIIQADSQCLPSHWIYNPGKIIRKFVDFPVIGEFSNRYHPGKGQNDNTHYGDQFIDTIEYYLEKKNEMSYDEFYIQKMNKYTGYIDGATKETLEKSMFGELVGSNSNEIGGICRALPHLVLDKDQNIHSFVEFSGQTHASSEAKQTAAIYYQIITTGRYDFDYVTDLVSHCTPEYVEQVGEKLKIAKELMESRDFNEIAEKLGSSCHFFDALPLITFIMNRYNEEQDQLAANFYLGGDNASRAMIIAAIRNFPKN